MIIDRKNYLKTVRVEFGKELGGEKPEDAYFIIKEPDFKKSTELEAAVYESKLKNNNSILITKVQEILPELIVEHNLEIEKSKYYSNTEAVEIVFGKIEAALKVINNYFAEVKNPLATTSDEK